MKFTATHLISLLLVIAGVVVFMYSKYRVPPKVEFQQLTLVDLEGNSASLDDYAGKNIFITMWATWCKDCLVEMPDLQHVKEQLADENFVFLAISDYDIEKERAYATENDFDFTYLHMTESLKDIGIHAIPTNYIINQEGKVVYEKVGADLWREDATIQMIKDLVK
ncbi:MAG: peroxiredoxin family protein [Chitinophagales bacterium]